MTDTELQLLFETAEAVAKLAAIEGRSEIALPLAERLEQAKNERAMSTLGTASHMRANWRRDQLRPIVISKDTEKSPHEK